MTKTEKAPALLELTFRSRRQRVRCAGCQMVVTAEETNKAEADRRAWAWGMLGREAVWSLPVTFEPRTVGGEGVSLRQVSGVISDLGLIHSTSSSWGTSGQLPNLAVLCLSLLLWKMGMSQLASHSSITPTL